MRIAYIAVAALAIAGCSQTPKVETDPRNGRVDVDVSAVAPGIYVLRLDAGGDTHALRLAVAR